MPCGREYNHTHTLLLSSHLLLLLLLLLLVLLQVVVSPGSPPVSVQHLELTGDSWTAEVGGRRLKGSALLFTHAGEQVLTLWQDGRSYEFRCVVGSYPLE